MEVVVMVDPGATHNFISPLTIEGVNCLRFRRVWGVIGEGRGGSWHDDMPRSGSETRRTWT